MLWFLFLRGRLDVQDFDSISLDDADKALRALNAHTRWERAYEKYMEQQR